MSEMDGFAGKLAALCAAELPHARRDADRMGIMIERLCDSLALTIAVAARGDDKGIDDMVMGADSHITVRAAEHAKIARILDGPGLRLPRDLP